VDLLIQQVANEHGLELGAVATRSSSASAVQDDDQDLAQRLAKYEVKERKELIK
jgi:hypothetical protein